MKKKLIKLICRGLFYNFFKGVEFKVPIYIMSIKICNSTVTRGVSDKLPAETEFKAWAKGESLKFGRDGQVADIPRTHVPPRHSLHIFSHEAPRKFNFKFKIYNP